MTPDEQPQQMSEVTEPREDAAEEENSMEVNCNGHSSTLEKGSNVEAQGTKQSAEEEEEEEDQRNANQPENNTESKNTLNNKEEGQTCNGLPGDADLQQLPTSVSPDSVTVELKEGNREDEEEMDTRGDPKRENKEKDGEIG